MKRLGSIICLVALIVTMTANTCFAAQTLKIEDSYPVDGQKNTTKENLCVKLTFNEEVGTKDIKKANSECFKITDENGKKVPIKVFFDPDDSKKVMVLADTTKKLNITDNTEYTLTIDPAFQDKNGNTLDKEKKISFTTMDQAKGTKVYMLMMVLMFVGIFAFSTLQAKKQAAKMMGDEKEKEAPFNPYKEAKKTGKPVEEIIAEHEKEVEKKKAKEARKAAHEKRKNEDEEIEDEEPDNGNYKVKRPRPIADGGSSYITGRKAEAEARIAEEERLARRRAANKKKKK